MALSKRDVVIFPHHKQLEVCTTRAAYRQGKKLTAVKVYTVNNESQHLLLCGVPSLGLQDELKRLCARFGDVRSIVFIPQYAHEEFTDTYHVQYTRIQSARYAKRHLDCRSFYGGVLHVCYAPEMESLAETRAKLGQRRKEIATRTRGKERFQVDQTGSRGAVQQQESRLRKYPEDERPSNSNAEDASCIWRGVRMDIDPRKKLKPAPELLQAIGPKRPDERWLRAGVKERKLMVEEQFSNNRTNPVTRPNTFCVSAPRLIPRQVKVKGKIIYRNKSSAPEDNHTTDSLAEANKSLEATVQAVRAKIRSVSVPNVQILLERKDDEPQGVLRIGHEANKPTST